MILVHTVSYDAPNVLMQTFSCDQHEESYVSRGNLFIQYSLYSLCMKKLKEIDYKILFELIKNSKISDRKLAHHLGVSQPTVTRKRARLEKETISNYTAIPDWTKLGYEILAITLVKTKQHLGLEENFEAVRKKAVEWVMNQPNVLFCGGCRGMGMDGFMVSVHQSYSDFDKFMLDHKRELGDQVNDSRTVFVNLRGDTILKPLNFKYLAEAEQVARM